MAHIDYCDVKMLCFYYDVFFLRGIFKSKKSLLVSFIQTCVFVFFTEIQLSDRNSDLWGKFENSDVCLSALVCVTCGFPPGQY